MPARNYHVTHHIPVDTVTVTAPRTTIILNNPLRGGCSTQYLQISNPLNHCGLFEMRSHSYTSKIVTSWNHMFTSETVQLTLPKTVWSEVYNTWHKFLPEPAMVMSPFHSYWAVLCSCLAVKKSLTPQQSATWAAQLTAWVEFGLPTQHSAEQLHLTVRRWYHTAQKWMTLW